MNKKIRIVFDGPPGPEAGRFVEVENEDGASIAFGEWKEEGDYWYLEFDNPGVQEQNIILREYVQLLRYRLTKLTFQVHEESGDHDSTHAKLCTHGTCKATRAVLAHTHDYNTLGETE